MPDWRWVGLRQYRGARNRAQASTFTNSLWRESPKEGHRRGEPRDHDLLFDRFRSDDPAYTVHERHVYKGTDLWIGSLQAERATCKGTGQLLCRGYVGDRRAAPAGLKGALACSLPQEFTREKKL
jgi:hypothetical protein